MSVPNSPHFARRVCGGASSTSRLAWSGTPGLRGFGQLHYFHSGFRAPAWRLPDLFHSRAPGKTELLLRDVNYFGKQGCCNADVV